LINLTYEQKRAGLKEQVKKMRLLDDDFMTKVFEENLECTEFMLRIVLEIPDLIVKSAITQYGIKNLQGRSVRLDVHAVDGKGKIYDIEVERSDKGAKPRRIRYNRSLLDANSVLPGDDISLLPETYIIMFTEDDFWGKGEPIYPINSYVGDTGIKYDDGSHIIYVNGAYKDTPSQLSALGKLIHDFNCKDANDMYYPILADRVRYYKEDEKGIGEMCKIIEDIVKEDRKEVAITLIKIDKLSLEEIAEASKLSLDEVKKLQESLLVGV
jgi:hypothetical protein